MRSATLTEKKRLYHQVKQIAREVKELSGQVATEVKELSGQVAREVKELSVILYMGRSHL